MQYIREPKFLGTRRVRVEDDVLASQMLFPNGVQSCLLMGPGPGARRTVRPGFKRVRMSVSGFPFAPGHTIAPIEGTCLL